MRCLPLTHGIDSTRTPRTENNSPAAARIVAPPRFPISARAESVGFDGCRDTEPARKAWCVWLNSTFGIIALLNARQRNLTYPSFSLDGLRSLPVPHSSYCGIAALAEAYDQHADDMLRPFPEVHTDPVRQALDDAVLMAVPGLSGSDVARWRQSISLEPSVNNEKEPFGLS